MLSRLSVRTSVGPLGFAEVQSKTNGHVQVMVPPKREQQVCLKRPVQFKFSYRRAFNCT